MISQLTKQGALKKILIIDDDHTAIRPITDFMSHLGLYTKFAFDGLNAVNEIKNNNFDLIVIDWMMPYKNGYDTLITIDKLLSRDKSFLKKSKKIPYFIYSGMSHKSIHIPTTNHLTFLHHISKMKGLYDLSQSINFFIINQNGVD